MFADKVFRLEVPYGEYLIPLLIGVGVGLCAVTLARFALGRRRVTPFGHKIKNQQLVVDPFVQGSPSELRKSMRRDGNPTEVYVALGEQKDRPICGWVLDRSIGGIGLAVAQEIAPGTMLSILPVNATTMTPWVEVEVKTCRQNNDSWDLGCQFVKTPPWSILLMFG